MAPIDGARYTLPVIDRLTIIHALEKNRLTTGSVVQMMEAARGLAARGHRVTVVSRPGGDLEAACAGAGLDLVSLPLAHEADLRSVRALPRLLRGSGVQDVHVHQRRPPSISRRATARRSRSSAFNDS